MKKWLYHLNILQRLLLYFLVVIIVSITIAIWLIYRKATTEIEQQQAEYLEYIAKNASYQTNLFVQELEYQTLPIINNDRVKGYLEVDHTDKFQQFLSHKYIKNLMDQFLIQDENFQMIFVLGRNGQSILSEGQLKVDEEVNSFEQIYEDLKEGAPEATGITLSLNKSLHKEYYVLRLLRNVRSRTNFHTVGILGIEIEATALAKLWEISSLKNNTSLWVFDQHKRIIFHPDDTLVGRSVDPQLLTYFTKDHETFQAKWEEEEMIFYYDTIPELHWTIVAMTPLQNVYEPLKGLKQNLLVSVSISLLIALVLAIGFANSIVKPLRKVQKGMRQTEEGDWMKIPPLKGQDEISSVVSSYNKMIDKLAVLIKNLTEAEIKNHQVTFEKQAIEFQALELQINPHFLHNTLETINAYAVINDETEISEMTVALSQMFRYAIRNLEVVTIKEEIEHIENYLVIVSYRFQKRFDVNFDIDEALYDEEIAKLTLQPLVENAIQHGLSGEISSLTLTIRATQTDDLMIIEIIDNGAGISRHRLEEIRQVIQSEQSQQIDSSVGIGLRNVNRRIQLIFGDEYGLHIVSQEGKGTTVFVRIPR